MKRIRKKSSDARIRFLAFIFAFCFFGVFVGGAKQSHALLILEDMIFIGENGAAATFKVKNTGKTPLAYRVEWLQLRMKPDGTKEKVMPGDVIENVHPAEPYMFLAPRRLILQPGQIQHIRFMVRRMKNLEPGEYRSYIMLQPEKIPQEYTAENNRAGKASGLASAQISILTGFRIPVFFLHGDTTLNTEITQIGFDQNKQGKNGVHFTFVREGNRSAIGELTLRCVGDEGESVLSKMNIKIFTEISMRRYFLPFEWPTERCKSVAFDYLLHKLDPDYTRKAVRMAEIPVN